VQQEQQTQQQAAEIAALRQLLDEKKAELDHLQAADHIKWEQHKQTMAELNTLRAKTRALDSQKLKDKEMTQILGLKLVEKERLYRESIEESNNQLQLNRRLKYDIDKLTEAVSQKDQLIDSLAQRDNLVVNTVTNSSILMSVKFGCKTSICLGTTRVSLSQIPTF
jgi:hypothetical protein